VTKYWITSLCRKVPRFWVLPHGFDKLFLLLRSFPDEYGDVQSNPWSKKTRGKERDSPGGVRSILSEYYICTSVHYSCGDGDHLPQQPPTTMLLLVFTSICMLSENIFFSNNAGSEFFYLFWKQRRDWIEGSRHSPSGRNASASSSGFPSGRNVACLPLSCLCVRQRMRAGHKM